MSSSVPRRFPVDLLGLDADLRQTLDELEKQQKQQHKAAMVAYCKAKKEEHKRLHSELHQLEHQVKQLVESVTAAATRSSQEQDVNQTPAEELRGLVAEQEILRIQNLALREEIGRHETFRLKLEAERFCKELSQDESSRWCVDFDRNVYFRFSPYTRGDFDAGMNQFDLELALSVSSLSFAGEFLGWSVHRAPLVASPLGSTIAQVRLAKRDGHPFDILLGSISYTKDKDLTPVIVSPIGFGIHQRHEVATQLLQEFDQDSLVFAHDIPGANKHLRYIYFVRWVQWQLRDGRRKRELTMAIVDSHDRRDTERLQENVEWADEGGINISVTEVDGTFIDVVCDRWASCPSKLQADYNMVQWAQYANWWEQTVAPDSLLL